MAVNKVDFGDETLIDLTNDTVTPQTLADGVTAHDASGNEIVGTMGADGGGIVVDPLPIENSANAVSSGGVYAMFQSLVDELQGTISGLNERINELEDRLGGLSFQKSSSAPNVSTDENMITFVG